IRQIHGYIPLPTFKVPMKSNFDLADGYSTLFLGEMSGLQQVTCMKLEGEHLNDLNQTYLPSMRCPPVLNQDYCHVLQYLNAKQFKNY
ncbi:hypothetical protein BGZ81_005972, partial [Podila clonocystis]